MNHALQVVNAGKKTAGAVTGNENGRVFPAICYANVLHWAQQVYFRVNSTCQRKTTRPRLAELSRTMKFVYEGAVAVPTSWTYLPLVTSDTLARRREVAVRVSLRAGARVDLGAVGLGDAEIAGAPDLQDFEMLHQANDSPMTVAKRALCFSRPASEPSTMRRRHPSASAPRPPPAACPSAARRPPAPDARAPCTDRSR